MATPPRALAQLARFRLLLRQFLAFSESASEHHGLPAQQYQLLQVIAAGVAEQPTITVSYIAERMVLRHNSAVELVDRAQRAGLVDRASDPADHRRTLIVLTAKGSGVLAALITEHLDYLRTHGPDLIQALQHVTGPRKA